MATAFAPSAPISTPVSASAQPTSPEAQAAAAVEKAKVAVLNPDSIEAELAKKGNKIYVTIPEKNILGWDHPGIGLNLQSYGPGTHLVDQLVGEEIQRRLDIYNNEMLRLLQPQVSSLVQRKLAGGL